MKYILGLLAEQGITLAALLFGCLGAALGVGFTESLTRRQSALAFIAGCVCAAVIPQAAGAYYDMHPYLKNALAFVNGILGMWIVMLVIKAGQTAASNPMVFFDWAFRRGAPPPAAPDREEKK